jgi:hypothetical protein
MSTTHVCLFVNPNCGLAELAMVVEDWTGAMVQRLFAAELAARGSCARVVKSDAPLLNAYRGSGPGLAACEVCGQVIEIRRRRAVVQRTACREENRAGGPTRRRRSQRAWWREGDGLRFGTCLEPNCSEPLTRAGQRYCSDRCRKAAERYLARGGSIETPDLPYRLERPA